MKACESCKHIQREEYQGALCERCGEILVDVLGDKPILKDGINEQNQ